MCEKYINPAAEAMDYEQVDGEQAEMRQIIESAQTFPLISGRRIVWVRDFRALKAKEGTKDLSERELEQLLEYIDDPNDRAVLVLSNAEVDGRGRLGRRLTSKGDVYEFSRLAPRDLRSFAAKRFRAAGIRLTDRQMSALIQATGYENKDSTYRIDNFENDINKLISASAGGPVTEQLIEDTIAGDSDTFIFDMIDGISGNDKSRALEILHNRMSADPYDGMRSAAVIISQMEIMYQISEYQDKYGRSSSADIAKAIDANEYRVRKAMQYASRYSLEKLRRMLIDAYGINEAVATGLMQPDLALELFIGKI